MYIWKIIIRYAGTRKIIRFKGKEGQSSADVFAKAKEYAKQLKKADEDDTVSIDLVSGTRAYAPPKNAVIPKHQLWCPYCVKPRPFMEKPEIGVSKCPVCGISDSDFYVKKYNGIFREEYNDYLLSLKIPKKKEEA
jgi:hypothetical protein